MRSDPDLGFPLRATRSWRAKLGVLFGRAIIVFAALACGVVVVAVVAGGSLPRLTAARMLLLLIAPSVAFLAFAYIALRQQESVIRRVAAELTMLAFSLLAVESAIVLCQPDSYQRARETPMSRTRTMGLPVDSRTFLEVVAQLRASGVDALPGLGRDWARRASVRERIPKGFYPLSHASNVSVVECNESGEYVVYRTDEFGFNNPPGLVAGSQIEIAALGDSSMLGHCVPPEQSLVARLRERFPRTANFALAGSGNLSSLATFREYVEPLRPRVVLWSAGNNFDEEEFSDEVLTRYLDPAFSQHLRQRQSTVDEIIRKTVIPAAQAQFENRAKLEAELYRLSQIPTLHHLRYLLRQQFANRTQTPDERFVGILKRAKERTQHWGGEFVVVIIPSFLDLATQASHDRFLSLLTKHGISYIDGRELFLRQPDPAALFPMRITRNHLNGQGYALLADFVAVEVDKLLHRQRVAASEF